MDKRKGKKDFVEPEDRKGGKVSWSKVEELIDKLGSTWGIQAGDRRIGELKTNEGFNRQLGEVWMEWEKKTNEWWSEVCEIKKEAGGWLKVSEENIQNMVEGKKAPEWNNSTAWEWIERRVQEA